MKATSKTSATAGHFENDLRDHAHPADHHCDNHLHDHSPDHDDHNHGTGIGVYVRLGLMGLIVLASLTGWWRPFMNRDWLAFAGTVIGGFPIYREAWENLLRR